jgi:hypothetical protein
MPAIHGRSKAATIRIPKAVARQCLIGWDGVVAIIERYERGISVEQIHARTGMPLRIVRHVCAEYEARFCAWQRGRAS